MLSKTYDIRVCIDLPIKHVYAIGRYKTSCMVIITVVIDMVFTLVYGRIAETTKPRHFIIFTNNPVN